MFRRLLLVLSLFLILNLTLFYAHLKRGSVLGDIVQNANVSVTASLPFCPVIIITPEHRIPPTHNNSLELEVWIRPEGTGTTVWSTTVTTDNEGVASLCPIPAEMLPDQYYDILVKGLSHLRRNFTHQEFNGAGSTIDLTSPVLFAGDSHAPADNYVNSLDLSYDIIKIYTNDLRADLNRDGIVNSLDFPTMISHLYQYGDI